MLEIAKLHSEGHSTTAIASRVHLPVSLVQDVIDVSGPEIEEGGAAATRGEGSR